MSAQDNENKNFLVFAQTLVAMGAQELGAEQFDHFVEAAKCSDILVELGAAVSNVLSKYGQDEAEVTSGRCFTNACKHLLGLELSGTEASYILVYGQSIASTIRSGLMSRGGLRRPDRGHAPQKKTSMQR